MYRLLLCLVVCLVLLNPINALSQDYCWKDYIPGDIPLDAIQAAPGRYIGQVNLEGNLPATIFPHKGVAVTEFTGKKVIKDHVKILCSSQPHRFYWELVNTNKPAGVQMQNAVKGGFQFNLGENLYIGKVYHQDQWKIGKAFAIDTENEKGLCIWDDGDKRVTVRYFEYQLLKYNLSGTDIGFIPSGGQ